VIVIIEYGMGNVGSILNMFKKIGCPAIVSSKIEDIERAEKLIIPGVGAFDNGMRKLEGMGFIDVLNRKVMEDGTPVLGICLGMQLLTRRSEEGKERGLGWIQADTIRFDFSQNTKKLKIPHMGWNEIRIAHNSDLLKGLEQNSRFYFVHSYHVRCDDENDVMTTTEYGYEFASSIRRGNIMGTQFHPEKSHKFGIRFLTNFVEMKLC